MAFNQSCYGLRAKKEIVDEDFLYYLIKYNIRLLRKNTHGSVFDTITRSTFDEIEVDVPDLEVQKKIGYLLSELDKKIELNNKINNNLSPLHNVEFEVTHCGDNEETPQVFSSLLVA